MKKCIVMVVALVLVGMMNVGLCAGGGPILYNDRGITVMATDAEIDYNYISHKGKPVLRVYFEVRNDSDKEQLIQCKEAIINNWNHISGGAWVSLGAHSVKKDSLSIYLEEAGLTSADGIESFAVVMTSCDVEGNNKFEEHEMKSKIPGSWLKRALQ